MHWIDWTVIGIYSVGLLALGYLFREQKDKRDYFLGGRSFGWFSMGMSVMASQLSAISFISAAAFVGMKQGGGMQWLTFEFAVPLAMIFLIVVLVPPLYRAGIVSVYAWLETRFSPTTRLLLSGVFQFSRAFATGIMIYTVALVLASVMGIPMWQTILLSGVVTIIYSWQGGMKAVVWGDVVQMLILLAGIVLCIVYGLHLQGGWEAFVARVDHQRLEAVPFNWGVGEGQEFGFWPMLIGGFFLYISYYGCDQSQAQRALSGKSLKEVRRALLFNGLFRFPVTLAYCFMGLIVGTFAFGTPGFLDQIPADQPDRMIPLFIINYLPTGVVGLLLVAILAAAMSSLSSAINSLSAATLEDFVARRRTLDAATQVAWSRRLTLAWGLACIGLAFAAGRIAPTVIEAINKVGSAFYGPIVATFILGILSRRAHARAVNAGLIAGVAVNLFIWQSGLPVFWIWWNFIGAAITLALGYGLSLVWAPSGKKDPAELPPPAGKSWWVPENGVLLAWFALIVWFSLNLKEWI